MCVVCVLLLIHATQMNKYFFDIIYKTHSKKIHDLFLPTPRHNILEAKPWLEELNRNFTWLPRKTYLNIILTNLESYSSFFYKKTKKKLNYTNGCFRIYAINARQHAILRRVYLGLILFTICYFCYSKRLIRTRNDFK